MNFVECGGLACRFRAASNNQDRANGISTVNEPAAQREHWILDEEN